MVGVRPRSGKCSSVAGRISRISPSPQQFFGGFGIADFDGLENASDVGHSTIIPSVNAARNCAVRLGGGILRPTGTGALETTLWQVRLIPPDLMSFPAEAVDWLPLAPDDKALLVKAGLPPDAASFLSLEAPESADLASVTDQWGADPKLRRYRVGRIRKSNCD